MAKTNRVTLVLMDVGHLAFMARKGLKARDSRAPAGASRSDLELALAMFREGSTGHEQSEGSVSAWPLTGHDICTYTVWRLFWYRVLNSITIFSSLIPSRPHPSKLNKTRSFISFIFFILFM